SPVCCAAGTIFPALAAEAELTLEPLGATVTAFSNAFGNVSFVVPATPAAGNSYCLAASAPGYLPYSACGFSPSQLQQTSSVPLSPLSVVVNVTINGV